MNTPDIFALGGKQHEGDAVLLALFRQWIEAERAADRYSRDNPDDQDGFDERCNASWNMIRQMTALPVASATGLAIKAYMIAWFESDGPCDDAPAVSVLRTDTSLSTQMLISLVRALPSFVPEIAPLVIHEGDAA